jgi:hypothetical protein
VAVFCQTTVISRFSWFGLTLNCKKMGAETQKLATVSFVTDTDVSYYEIGEVEGSFQKDELKDYIKRFGHEKLCSQLAFLQFQVWEALREVNSERDAGGVKSALNGL